MRQINRLSLTAVLMMVLAAPSYAAELGEFTQRQNTDGTYTVFVQDKNPRAKARRVGKAEEQPLIGGYKARVTLDELRVLMQDPNVVLTPNRTFRTGRDQILDRHNIVPELRTQYPNALGDKGSVVIADTGVDYTIAELSGRVVAEACFSTRVNSRVRGFCPGGVNSSTAAGSGKNCPPNLAQGCHHGTEVAGIAVGKTKGVAPQGKYIPHQIFTACQDSVCTVEASLEDFMSSLSWTYNNRTTYNIVGYNASIEDGAPYDSCNTVLPALTTAINNLVNNGVMVFLIAGNGGYDGKASLPGCITSAFTASALNPGGTIWSESNMDENVDSFAVGADVQTPGIGGTIRTDSGTSLSAPVFLGYRLLLEDQFPNATRAQNEAAMKCGPTVSRAGITKRTLDAVRGFRRVSTGAC